MSKRFIDSELFDDSWFMDLSLSGKILWVYCITKCDHAGILELNEKLAQFQTGVKNIDTVIKELGNRLVRVNEQYIFIPKFIDFQYPGFPNSKVRQQSSAVEILKKFNLFDNTTQTVSKEFTNSYDNDTDNGIDTGTVNEPVKSVGNRLMRNDPITLELVRDSFLSTDDLKIADPKYYFNAALDWSNSKGEMRIDWIATVKGFARRDLKDGKMKVSVHKPSGGSNLGATELPETYGLPSKTAVPMPDSIKNRILNIGK